MQNATGSNNTAATTLAYNTVTGLFWGGAKVGFNATVEGALPVCPSELAALRYSFLNVATQERQPVAAGVTFKRQTGQAGRLFRNTDVLVDGVKVGCIGRLWANTPALSWIPTTGKDVELGTDKMHVAKVLMGIKLTK